MLFLSRTRNRAGKILLIALKLTLHANIGVEFFYLLMKPLPIQPPETDWHFVQELQSPLWTQHDWKPRAARSDEASFADGVSIIANFPDENNLDL